MCLGGIAKQKMKYKFKGFTLIELMVVMAILGVLVTIALVSFRSSQMRGRDAQRKANIKEISSALELFYSDYQKYPSEVGGLMQGCPFDSATGTGASCTWGEDEFTDNKTIYFKVLPKDPSDSFNYYYRVVDPPVNQKFQLFAYLENVEDPACLGGDCASSPVAYSCGSGKSCNFSMTSPNTDALE